jgi:peptidoglycan/LPS O-acetylase OafA/YrhL
MPALTGIRLPLAFWVVAHHMAGPGRMLQPLTSASSVIDALLEAAWTALSVFFAISGFVLARRYRHASWNRQSVRRYAVARFARIYPLYLLSLLILLPIITETLRLGTGAPMETTDLLVTHVLLLQGWHWPPVNWNMPAWSLSSEVFYYACLPLLLIPLRRLSWPRVAATTAVACGVPIVLRLLIEAPIPKAPLYFGDFIIGIAAAGAFDLLRARVDPQRLGPWLYGPALAGGIALLLSRDAMGSFLVFDTGLRIVTAVLVLGLACGGGWLVRGLSSAVVLTGGRASYAVYILHVPVLWWFERWHLDRAFPPLQAAAIYLAIVTALSLIVSRWFEAPVNALVRNFRLRAQAAPELRVPRRAAYVTESIRD